MQSSQLEARSRQPAYNHQLYKWDLDGDIQIDDQDNVTKTEPHKYDWTKVKLPRSRWETKRPAMSATMDSKVTNELEKHIDENYRGENCPTTRPQRDMSPDTRKQKIQQNILTE